MKCLVRTTSKLFFAVRCYLDVIICKMLSVRKDSYTYTRKLSCCNNVFIYTFTFLFTNQTLQVGIRKPSERLRNIVICFYNSSRDKPALTFFPPFRLSHMRSQKSPLLCSGCMSGLSHVKNRVEVLIR